MTVATEQPPGVAAPPSTILVVDDSPVNLQVLVRTLDGAGHRILAARDGRAALEIARRARPNLMLLDLMMPGLDGFEVCRAIKADPLTRDTAVIFLSARGDVSDKVSGLQLGAVDYITKPIQTEEVQARVANHLMRQYLERELRHSLARLDHELESAGAMQRLILPSALPSHPSVQFAAHYRTSRHAGGDYYDVLELGPNRFGIMVADVSGHGAPSAIVMAMIRAVLHSLPNPDDPPAVLRHLNRHFAFLWESSMFATAVYAVLDAERRTLRLSCAGHPPPLRLRPAAPVVPIPVDAVRPLLFGEVGEIPCHEEILQPGDRILMYTDGITDREAADGTLYEEPRLRSALAGARALAPDALVRRIVADVEGFAGGREPDDDQTLVAVGID
jgi:serine phosphatase RsbU (regulator of sigma subunit)